MFDHVVFAVSDFSEGKAFFVNALEPLGVVVVSDLAFIAADRRQVDDVYRAALAAGGQDNGAPGLRPQYHANYYAAFVIGPDGHNIEAVCHEPAPS